MPAERSSTAQLIDLVPICNRLPSMSVDQLIGATRVMARAGSHMSQRKLGTALHLDDEQIVGVLDFLSRLGLVEAIGSEIALTESGKSISASKMADRRRLFAEPALRLPIVRDIVDALSTQPSRSLPRDKLLHDLGAHTCPSDADRVFDHVMTWGRYAGLFHYDRETELVRLS
jgi:NitT/TauT family transport system ATP-binding protein